MNATVLDTITTAFVDALQGGTNALAIFSIPYGHVRRNGDGPRAGELWRSSCRL